MSTAERQRTSARRDSLLGDRPGAFASARYVRITPMKARRVVDLVRGVPVDQALSILQFAPQAAAETVHKVLRSAVANAETTEGLDTHDLVVSVAQVDEGPTMKRWWRGRGGAGPGRGGGGAGGPGPGPPASTSGPATSPWSSSRSHRLRSSRS